MSNQIQQKIVYLYKNQEFKSLDAIKLQTENDLGRFIDRAPTLHIPPKDKLKLFDYIVKNKRQLVELLTIEVDTSDDAMYNNIINILDY